MQVRIAHPRAEEKETLEIWFAKSSLLEGAVTVFGWGEKNDSLIHVAQRS